MIENFKYIKKEIKPGESPIDGVKNENVFRRKIKDFDERKREKDLKKEKPSNFDKENNPLASHLTREILNSLREHLLDNKSDSSYKINSMLRNFLSKKEISGLAYRNII